MNNYFRGTNLRGFILGAVVLAVLTLLVPVPERWRHTVGVARMALTIGPWMLRTMARERPLGYVVFAVSSIAGMAAIEAMFR
jgi:hypothetical protein